VTSPAPKVLGPRRSAEITAVFDLSTFADGQFLVSGKVTGSGFETKFVTSTATTPWGLYLLGLLMAVGVLLAVATFIGRLNTDRNQNTNETIQNNDGGNDLTAPLSTLGVSQ
jgi:hypothetical protein